MKDSTKCSTVPRLEAMRPVEVAPADVMLKKLADVDPTGGVSILDCKHGFSGLLIVGRKGEWHFVVGGKFDCDKCQNPIATITTRRINCCPICGIACDVAPHRNYIIGQEKLLDSHLLTKLKLFNVIEPRGEGQ